MQWMSLEYALFVDDARGRLAAMRSDTVQCCILPYCRCVRCAEVGQINSCNYHQKDQHNDTTFEYIVQPLPAKLTAHS